MSFFTISSIIFLCFFLVFFEKVNFFFRLGFFLFFIYVVTYELIFIELSFIIIIFVIFFCYKYFYK